LEIRERGGALHSTPDLVLVTADADTHPQTTQASLEAISSAQITEEDGDSTALHSTQDWLDLLPSTEATRIRRHTNVSQDHSRYTHIGLSASDYDAECTATPNQIPPWVLPPEEAQALFEAGHGTALDLIYARGYP
jgi:hypothetical protein